MHREDFFEQVWDLVSQIPCGFVTTYGDIAKMLGSFTVLRLTSMMGMANVSFTKEELLKMNAQLNKIRKPKK